MNMPILEKTENIKKIKDFIFEKLEIDGYEEVYKISNPKTNLLCVIAIHNTTLGVALGGTRIRVYKTFDEALNDVKRLSQGMTYKAAVAEVGFGGGKSVIILKDEKDKTKELLLSFGEAVDLLNGKYICAEDMGCSPEDTLVFRQKTKYVVGLPTEKSSGNPSRFTAWGVFRGMQATLNKLFNSGSIKGKTIAIQGLGSVGELLLEHLFWAGADLIVSDIDDKRAKRLSLKFGAKVVPASEILKQKCDILAPCAIGGIINDESIKDLDTLAICGCANNQLLEMKHASDLKNKNILYAPDFVVNAGGLFNVTEELEKNGYHPRSSKEKIDKIYNEILNIYHMSEKEKITTHEAAIKIAKNKIKCGIGIRKEKLHFPFYDRNELI